MLIMTTERCPQCDSLIYMLVHPKQKSDVMTVNGLKEIADGCYLDRDGVMCITAYNPETKTPDYYCIFCRWVA